MNRVNHVAIIMDGNGRWGKKRGKSRKYGHANGVKVIENSCPAFVPMVETGQIDRNKLRNLARTHNGK